MLQIDTTATQKLGVEVDGQFYPYRFTMAFADMLGLMDKMDQHKASSEEGTLSPEVAAVFDAAFDACLSLPAVVHDRLTPRDRSAIVADWIEHLQSMLT